MNIKPNLVKLLLIYVLLLTPKIDTIYTICMGIIGVYEYFW